MERGFYLCKVKCIYYINVTSESIIPFKKNEFKNRNYQHSEITQVIRKLNVINDYYLIKKEIKSILKEKDGIYDIEKYYKLGCKDFSDMTVREQNDLLSIKKNRYYLKN